MASKEMTGREEDKKRFKQEVEVMETEHNQIMIEIKEDTKVNLLNNPM